jgi:hypothetical protein
MGTKDHASPAEPALPVPACRGRVVERGRLNFRPIEIRFEKCLGSATALSLQRPLLFVIPREPRDLRCAIRVPRSYRPQPSTNHHRILMETTTSPLSFRVSRVGPRNRRSLGFARDDKKGRFAQRRGPLPRGRAIVGAVGTSTTRHLHRQQPFCAKSRKSQPLGMTKRRGSLQGEGSCWMKEWLLNRGIFSNLI